MSEHRNIPNPIPVPFGSITAIPADLWIIGLQCILPTILWIMCENHRLKDSFRLLYHLANFVQSKNASLVATLLPLRTQECVWVEMGR